MWIKTRALNIGLSSLGLIGTESFEGVLNRAEGLGSKILGSEGLGSEILDSGSLDLERLDLEGFDSRNLNSGNLGSRSLGSRSLGAVDSAGLGSKSLGSGSLGLESLGSGSLGSMSLEGLGLRGADYLSSKIVEGLSKGLNGVNSSESRVINIANIEMYGVSDLEDFATELGQRVADL